MSKQMSNVTRLERNASRELNALREEWNILTMELDALNTLLKTAYANHEHLPDEMVEAVIQGLSRRLEKMKAT